MARLVDLPRHRREDGDLVVVEAAAQVPFVIERIFTLTAPKDARRGNHAHRFCSQFLICDRGAVDVDCDDGHGQQIFTLDRGNQGLLVPPLIWNTVIFREPDSAIIVLCDRRYEENDYLRDYAEFIAMRKGPQP